MKPIIFVFCLALMTTSCKHTPTSTDQSAAAPELKRAEYALVIHGGAGTIRKEELAPGQEDEIRKVLNDALTAGEEVLRSGGSALDAVEKVIVHLEDSPQFNAGRGAVFTHEGKNELDASIMDGATQKAGACGGVTNIKNPIRLARAVMEKSPHVLLTGRGAEQFGAENGLETAKPEWFYTKERWESLQKALDAARKNEDNSKNKLIHKEGPANPDYKYGTVGCVALDKSGNIAAGTSTGGMTNKRWNRFGDSPIIGAGTYADNAVCGVSCTGHGEYFIRYAVAHDVWALISYKNMPLDEATSFVVNKKLVEKGGEGGLIALDKWGNVAMPYNSAGMYRGYVKPGERTVKIWQE